VFATNQGLGRAYTDPYTPSSIQHKFQLSSLKFYDAGGFPITLKITWAAEFRVNGGGWQGLGSVTGTFASRHQVRESWPVLINSTSPDWRKSMRTSEGDRSDTGLGLAGLVAWLVIFGLALTALEQFAGWPVRPDLPDRPTDWRALQVGLNSPFAITSALLRSLLTSPGWCGCGPRPVSRWQWL
jgi:hypothetical protein